MHIYQSPNVTITIETEGQEPIILNDISEYLILIDTPDGAMNSRYQGNAFSILGRANMFIDWLKRSISGASSNNT
jgi:hypothetical protein